MASTIPPYEFKPLSYNSEWSVTESTKSDTETEFINIEYNQHRVGAVSCHFRMVFVWTMRFNAYGYGMSIYGSGHN